MLSTARLHDIGEHIRTLIVGASGYKLTDRWPARRYDAFTHKQTSQYSLAFEKASIIFNISAVHSCHAANQNRSEELGIKTAFHSFQASAGMFTYINENFLHAPSTDLSRETVKTLISIMLAQAQEVFLEKQIADGKKPGMLAKLAAQAGLLYSQAVEGVQENSQKGVFERVWLLVCQVWLAMYPTFGCFSLIPLPLASRGSTKIYLLL